MFGPATHTPRVAGRLILSVHADTLTAAADSQFRAIYDIAMTLKLRR
jgi:hypothetical protein